MNENKTDILLLDDEHKPILIEDECTILQSILIEFVEYYKINRNKPVEEWLSQKMQEQLPDRKSEKIIELTNEIITTLKTDEENQLSLNKAILNSRSKESWFASITYKTISAMPEQEAAKHLIALDNALQKANESLCRTIITQAGIINQNSRLTRFIAEQYHAGKLVRRYQSKYCKDTKTTEQMFEHEDYRGQQKFVPESQENTIQKKFTTIIEALDGTTSNPLTKLHTEQIQNETQSGKWNELNFNEYATKNLAIGIGKQAEYAALQGAAIGVGFDIAQKLCNRKEIETKEVVETALVSGTDFGIKAAAGALKVGIEKEIITIIPKDTPTETIANIAYVAIENIKVVGKIMSGKLSFKEGVEKIEQTTVIIVSGLPAMRKGTAVEATIEIVLGSIGMAVGGFLGGTIGYMAGSKVGETIVEGTQKIRNSVIKFVKTVHHELRMW